jgi:molybdopterin converting factor subunit 1
MITVLFFAAARERAGVSTERLEGPLTVQALLEQLTRLHPGLQPVLPHLRVAVNQEFAAGPDAPVPDGAEVALIPPVAGGSGGLFKVVDAPLRLQEAIDAVSTPAHGGLVTFTGAVRDQTRGQTVTRLEYEAYGPMAERKLREIGDEVQQQWPGTRLAIVHRTGTLLPGEAAVVIAASSPHRKEAFRACEHAIERLKQDVPIWKKEHYASGEVWVGLGP